MTTTLPRVTLMLLSGVVTFASSGCQYDRSFMQLDSNSGAPFFGLQWSVDARDTQRADRASAVTTPSVAATATPSDAARPNSDPTAVAADVTAGGNPANAAGPSQRRYLSVAASGETAALIPTADSGTPPRVRHSLPVRLTSHEEPTAMERLWLF